TKKMLQAEAVGRTERRHEIGVLAPQKQDREGVPLQVPPQQVADEAPLMKARKGGRSIVGLPAPAARRSQVLERGAQLGQLLLEMRVHDEAKTELVLPRVQLAVMIWTEAGLVRHHPHAGFHDAGMLKGAQVGL